VRRFALLPLLLAVFMIGCAHTQSRPGSAESPEIPTGLLTGRDALIVVPVTVAPGVNVPSGNLDRFTNDVLLALNRPALRHRVPPAFARGTAFRSERPAEVHVEVISLHREQRRRFGWIGSKYPVVSAGVSVEFTDPVTGQPLGEAANLEELAGPAEGGSVSSALAVAARQVAAHVARDLQVE
jgi:hypothetical protein